MQIKGYFVAKNSFVAEVTLNQMFVMLSSVVSPKFVSSSCHITSLVLFLVILCSIKCFKNTFSVSIFLDSKEKHNARLKPCSIRESCRTLLQFKTLFIAFENGLSDGIFFSTLKWKLQLASSRKLNQ